MSESQNSQEKPGGNTKPPGNQCYKWCFTWPYYVEEDKIITASQISQLLKVWCKSFNFQLEQGKSGYIHYQGMISLIRKENLNTIKNIFGCKIHFEPTKDYFASLNYTTKAETKIGGPWNQDSTFIKIIENLYEWQIRAEYICLNDYNDRKIYWLWDEEGCNGKTAFCKYMYVTHEATVLGNGALKDIAHALPDNPKIILFNITRDLEERMNYSALEAVKDGMIFSSKYDSKMKVFNSPVVMVFANFAPRLESMSLDRWDIINVK